MRRVAAENFEGVVARWFGRNELSIDVPAIVAFSGGPDSTALLGALVSIGAGPLRAVHVDHGIRPREERAEEGLLVAKTAERLGIGLDVVTLPEGQVASFARGKGLGLEAAARAFRHRALSDARKASGALRIYVGHTRDDDLEGLLLRFLGGSGSAGLRGLASVSGPIARPLLDLGRADVLDYLRERRLGASSDSTNTDTSILRNRVRARLVPLLDAEFPAWRGGLLRTSRRIRLDDDALDVVAAPARAETATDRSRRIRFDAFSSLPTGLRFRVLAEAIDGLVTAGLCPEFIGGRVPTRMIEAAISAIALGKAFSGHGVSIVRDGEWLKVGGSLDFKGGDGYFVVLKESDIGVERPIPGGGSIALAWTTDLGRMGIPEGNFDFPLIVRTRRPGDRIDLPSGSRPVDRLGASKGGPSGAAGVAIVQDRHGIVAVLGSNDDRGRDVFRGGPPKGDVLRLLSLRLKGA